MNTLNPSSNNALKTRVIVLTLSVSWLVAWCLSYNWYVVTRSAREETSQPAVAHTTPSAWQRFSMRLMELEEADHNKKIQQKEEELKKSLYSLTINCSKIPKSSPIQKDSQEIRSLTDMVAGTVDTSSLYRLAVRSLVQVESQFDQDALSDTGAIGLMQLTPIVCEDMIDRTRRDRYMSIFRSVHENAAHKDIFSPNTWRALELWARGETPWENYIQFLWDHRRDPSVNLLIGNVYYRSLWKENPSKGSVWVAIEAAKNYNGSNRILESGRYEKDVHTERFATILRANI